MAAAPDPLAQIPVIYHFTDKGNIPMIKHLGGLYSTALLKEMGNAFCAGGDEDSLALDTRCGLDKFVHLCFVTGHPMAFRVKERKPDADLIYLQIDRAILHQPDIMFATGVGYANNAETVTLSEAVERNLIDFGALCLDRLEKPRGAGETTRSGVV